MTLFFLYYFVHFIMVFKQNIKFLWSQSVKTSILGKTVFSPNLKFITCNSSITESKVLPGQESAVDGHLGMMMTSPLSQWVLQIFHTLLLYIQTWETPATPIVYDSVVFGILSEDKKSNIKTHHSYWHLINAKSWLLELNW